MQKMAAEAIPALRRLPSQLERQDKEITPVLTQFTDQMFPFIRFYE